MSIVETNEKTLGSSLSMFKGGRVFRQGCLFLCNAMNTLTLMINVSIQTGFGEFVYELCIMKFGAKSFCNDIDIFQYS